MGVRLDNAKALYMEGIRDGKFVEAINRYAGDRYVQHSTPVRDGKEGFIEFFADFVQRNPDRDIEIVRGFEDGRYVFLHALQTLNGGESRWVTADIFDTDDEGRMIEHWDIIQEVVDETVSGHTQVDGPTEPTDLDKTEDNKALVSRFATDVLVNGQIDKLTNYISADTYIQHNPQVADGIEGLADLMKALADHGQSMAYREIHNVVGCGNFVAMLAHMDLAGRDMAVIDLFRVEDGLIVEHWDVVEEILPVDQWVNSGKF
ncbi:MAG: nuclear transport factor 2 family protein [Acidimicrobiia bacterium]|nr:nuclear transport factor 2 family protein [Acidimicrobiia bacterium]NNL29128.1 SnoaL-like domain-containing protein [Acidimicrobiia bacterium]